MPLAVELWHDAAVASQECKLLPALQAQAASDTRLARDIRQAEDKAEADAAEEQRLRQEELDSIDRRGGCLLRGPWGAVHVHTKLCAAPVQSQAAHAMSAHAKSACEQGVHAATSYERLHRVTVSGCIPKLQWSPGASPYAMESLQVWL